MIFTSPRFYIMHIEDRALKFKMITHHASVTQCLGSVGGHEWFLGVAKASIVDESKIGDGDDGSKVVRSKCGHLYVPPNPDDVRVFRVEGSKFLKLDVGTWHAGPLFKTKAMDFYNLELSNTNVSIFIFILVSLCSVLSSRILLLFVASCSPHRSRMLENTHILLISL